MLTLPTSRIPWHVQELALDYLLDGYIDGSLPVRSPDSAPLLIVYGEQWVQLIPGDEASLASANQSNNA